MEQFAPLIRRQTPGVERFKSVHVVLRASPSPPRAQARDVQGNLANRFDNMAKERCLVNCNELWGLTKLVKSSHGATADGSFGFIPVVIVKTTNADTTIEPSTGPCGKRNPSRLRACANVIWGVIGKEHRKKSPPGGSGCSFDFSLSQLTRTAALPPGPASRPAMLGPSR